MSTESELSYGELTKRIGELTPERRELLTRLLRGRGLAGPPPPIIARRRTAAALPLSFAQQRLWFLDQLAPGSASYNVDLWLPLALRLEVGALEAALNEVVRRQESLRTSFEARESGPVQVVAERLRVGLPVVDLRGMAGREQELGRLAVEWARQPFDLSVCPVWRAGLVRMGEEDWMLMVTMHHIITDGVSEEVLVEELTEIYEAYVRGEGSPLGEVGVQYGDYALWQREYLQGEVLTELLDYWTRRLKKAPVLQLPADFPRPSISTYCGAHISLALSREVTEGLKELSRRQGVTLFMTLLAAFQTLLYRYTGQEDLVIGTPVAGRGRAEFERLIGFFVNTLALRADLSGEPRFVELLGRVREVCVGAYEHQELPFEKLVEALQPERDLSRNPLFQVSFQLLNGSDSREDVTDASTRLADVERGTAMFDLSVDLWESGGGLSGVIEYSTDLFRPETIARLAGHYGQLLADILARPEARLSELAWLTADERAQVLGEWNETGAAFEPGVCLHHLFERQAARTPGRVAVEGQGTSLSYGELNRRANQVAHYLRGLGVGPETLVGVLLERSVEMVVGLLGVLKAGGAYLPLDPDYPGERLKFMLEDASVSLVLTEGRLIPSLAGYEIAVVSLDGDRDGISRESGENPPHRATEGNLALVIYTSGSTGRSKGVMLTHGGLCNRLLWGQTFYRLTEEDRILQMFSFSFDYSVWEVFTALVAGARLIMARPGGQRDGAYLVKLIAERQITVAGFVPSMLEVLLAEPGIEKCGCLRKVFSGGETLTAQLQERFFARLDAELQNTYGPTEASIDVTFLVCRRGESERHVPLGRPIANTQIYLLDAHLQPVPVGVPGEIYIGGAGLARGYHNRPATTAEKFIPDPFGREPGARLYRTGDLARYRADGNIEFLGRFDQQIKLHGFRIEPGEIEAVLGRHAGVKEVVVATSQGDTGQDRLVAYVVPRRGRAPTAGELSSLVRNELPGYMAPSAFVLLDSLPLTSNGKVDRQALPAPDRNRPDLAKPFVPPRTRMEEKLAGIWAEVLGVSQVGVRDNFFDLGGHSLLATQVTAKVRSVFRVELPLRNLFETPYVADLAEIIERAGREGGGAQAPAIVRVPREPNRAQLSAQRGLEVPEILKRQIVEFCGESGGAFEG